MYFLNYFIEQGDECLGVRMAQASAVSVLCDLFLWACLTSGTWLLAEVSGGALRPILVRVKSGALPLCIWLLWCSAILGSEAP